MSKYNNRKITVNGAVFDSKAEYERYRDLLLLEKAGKIQQLERQKKFEIIPATKGERAAVYTVDFAYKIGERLIAEEVKGAVTKDYVLRRKLFKWRYPEWEFVEIRDGAVNKNSKLKGEKDNGYKKSN